MQEWKLLSEPILYLSAYFEANRQEYYDSLLAVSQTGDWEGWLLYFLEGVRSQALEVAERIEKLKLLREELGKRVRDDRSSDNLFAVIDFLFGNPIASIRQVQEGIGWRSYKTAQRSIYRLEKMGIVREITARARDRLYQADEILEVIQG